MSLRIDSSPFDNEVVGSTVYAVGADYRFVVAKQHPGDGFGDFDSTITNYFIIDRTVPVEEQARQHKGIRGPLSRREFDRLARQLSLPTFTKRFHSLNWKKTGE